MPLQFTENAVATRAVPCERLRCGKIIKPGEARIAKEDVTNHIKYVCESCAKHYNEKEAAARLGSITHTGITRLLITLFYIAHKIAWIFSFRDAKRWDKQSLTGMRSASPQFPDYAPKCKPLTTTRFSPSLALIHLLS